MRWRLRDQLMLPMAVTMLMAVVVVGGWSALLSVRAARSRIETQLSQVARLLEKSNFPLSDTVLRQMHALSGARLVLLDAAGRILAASDSEPPLPLAEFNSSTKDRQSELASPIQPDGRDWRRIRGYFHTAVRLASRLGNPAPDTLHILYSEEEYRRAWQRAVVPSLVFVVAALPIVMILSAVVAARICRRVSRLQTQVGRIAQGDFCEVAISDHDDEIRALGVAVNHMAKRLARYDSDVRRTERLRTLAHLGGGIAHQLRNSATGCAIALDLHAQTCPTGETCEGLQVAKQQLRLMEQYIQRYLHLGRPQTARAKSEVDLVRLVEELLPLIEPAARHAQVDLRWFSRVRKAILLADGPSLRQLVINLLINAIEAAAQKSANPTYPAEVIVELSEDTPGRITLRVVDTGPGPAEAVQADIFEPFVTEKPDGVGLGLSVARQVAFEHDGVITWDRSSGQTCFQAVFPKPQPPFPSSDSLKENNSLASINSAASSAALDRL